MFRNENRNLKEKTLQYLPIYRDFPQTYYLVVNISQKNHIKLL